MKKVKVKKELWMPHPGHFICGNDCRFRLNTYVNGYIVSTVGELWPDSRVRQIKAECAGKKIVGMGDQWDANYFKEFGFDTVGYDRKYETMVFEAVRSKENKCCPYKITGSELDFLGYNDPVEAVKGHMKLLKKYRNKK